MIFNLSYLLICSYNILCVIYDKNKYIDNIKTMFYHIEMHHQKNDANVRIQKLVNVFLMLNKWLFNLLVILCFLY
jgi:hypothetical protein